MFRIAERSIETESAQFGREDRVKQLLDRSISELPTETLGAYLTISRAVYDDWQLNCVANATDFSCNVHSEYLFVFHYTPMPVSNYLLHQFDSMIIDILKCILPSPK